MMYKYIGSWNVFLSFQLSTTANSAQEAELEPYRLCKLAGGMIWKKDIYFCIRLSVTGRLRYYDMIYLGVNQIGIMWPKNTPKLFFYPLLIDID